MPNNEIRVSEFAPVRGMNTLDDTDKLQPGECLSLVNAYPGNPPRIRKGSVGQLLDGSGDWRFIPPAVSIEFGSSIIVLVWVYDTVAAAYRLLAIDTATAGPVTDLGAATFAATPMMGILIAHSCVYCSVSAAMATWKADTKAITHKVVESASIIRDLNIAASAAVSSLSQASGAGGVFSSGDCFEYAITYVRRNDSAAFESGSTPSGMILPAGITANYQPKEITTFSPGVAQSIEASANRKTLQITADTSYGTINISNSHASAIAQGATHIRLHRTRRQSSIANAQSATKYFLKDLPLGTGVVDFTDKISDATLAGETNQLITVGYNDAPAGAFIEYVKSRLWILSSAGIGYYSETPGGCGTTDLEDAQANPQLWASLFKAQTYRVDLDSIDGQLATGMARMGDDLYFMKERKIFCLFGGDPTVAVPTVISDVMGCAFPHTITKADVNGYFGKCILFLGNDGPVVIQEGGRVRSFSEFKIIQFWPERSTELYGELDSHYDWIIQNCSAAYWNNTWWIIYRTYSGTAKIFGFYFDPALAIDREGADRGPFETRFAEV